MIYKVSIHAPTWGATLHPHAHHLHNRRFNPRAHVGRDAGHQLIPLRRQKVSIHAPTWGATPLMVIACGVEPVSIHAPTWGATQASMPSPVPNISFNPRAHVGRDRWDSLNSVCCYVSIHAPTWGATLMPFSKRSFSLLFQSTRPRGARPLPFASVDSGIGFNPRAHVGRDLASAMRRNTQLSFQSTRPRGARPIRVLGQVRCIGVSIHAPTWGATSVSCAGGSTYAVSIHAPTWGATCKIIHNLLSKQFQSTRPRGARRIKARL